MNELILLKDLGTRDTGINKKHKRRYALYKCFCGNEFEALCSNINRGLTKSCGCYNIMLIKDRSITHGLTSHRLYKTWNNMMQRCNNQNIKSYKDYGGRGITICNEWLDIQNFINDMYPSFEEGLTLDRIDVNGNYCKENCRWATPIVQARNTRKIHKYNKTGYRGVCFNKKSNNYMANITIKYKQIKIGYYETALEGALAYDKYIIENNLEHTRNFTD